MQQYSAHQSADPEQADLLHEQTQQADHAFYEEERRIALAAAAVLSVTVLLAGLFLLQGARRYALTQDCALPGRSACDWIASN